MGISMIGVDYSKASVAERERFALTASRAEDTMRRAIACGAAGCVVLSTCNRTEIWLSGFEQDPITLLAGQQDPARDIFLRREEAEAVRYLFELACGMHSQIFGEDQILTQVGGAIDTARSCGCSDAVLEALFREAVTAAKAVKTETRLAVRNASVLDCAIDRYEREYGSIAGRRCLVIGNGEMGRMTAEKLLGCGALVTMTLRQYRDGSARVPEGCAVIAYSERYAALSDSDVVFSATLSPHYTILATDFPQKHQNPVILFDLAGPRDLDPRLRSCKGISLYDIDDLGVSHAASPEELQKAELILTKHIRYFEAWRVMRSCLPEIQSICDAAAEWAGSRIGSSGFPAEQHSAEQLQAETRCIIQKTIQHMLFGLRDELEPEQLRICISALHHAMQRD